MISQPIFSRWATEGVTIQHPTPQPRVVCVRHLEAKAGPRRALKYGRTAVSQKCFMFETVPTELHERQCPPL